MINPPIKTWEDKTEKASLHYGVFLPNRQRVYHFVHSGKSTKFFVPDDAEAIRRAEEIWNARPKKEPEEKPDPESTKQPEPTKQDATPQQNRLWRLKRFIP